MGAPDPKTLYDEDFYLWTQDQAERLRAMAGDKRLDIEHLADEVADLGRSELNKVTEHLTQLVAHLLVLAWLDNPPPSGQWRAEIVNHHIQARRTFTPGMRQHLDSEEIWADAHRLADAKLEDYDDPRLPWNLPVVINADELLNPALDVEAARTRVAAAIRNDIALD